MDHAYQRFLNAGIDLSPIGMERRTENTPYFCTPQGTEIFGWAGVDGIHYCFVDGFGEMVFSVSPMNCAPDYVHPLAKDFTDFLRLLLACGDSAALEQAWQWSETQFDTFLKENQPTKEQRSVLAQIAGQMNLTPMERPWQYMKELQADFDYGEIPYSKEYYDLVADASATPEPPEWKVYFDGNFWGHRDGQQAGIEIPVGTQFDWAGHRWVIPAIYFCSEGLVVDFCMQVEPADIRAFMEKWKLDIESEYQQFTREQQMQIDLDNPQCLHFNSVLKLNGKDLQTTHGCGTAYNPCLPDGYVAELEAKWAVNHYGLDADFGWVICRSCYPWVTEQETAIKTLSVTMMQQKTAIPGPHFQVHAPGDTFSFTYPEGSTEYTLTVQEYEMQTLDTSRLPQNMEYPTQHHAMTYTVMPELPDGTLSISDSANGDRPRQKPRPQKDFVPAATHDAAVIGIIGADGPTAIIYGQNRQQGKLRAACSSLHFEPVGEVEWRLIFHEKQFEDMTVDLYGNG